MLNVGLAFFRYFLLLYIIIIPTNAASLHQQLLRIGQFRSKEFLFSHFLLVEFSFRPHASQLIEISKFNFT